MIGATMEAGARSARRDAFLAEAGWGRADLRLLAGDASFRHYDRLTMDGRTAVLMDAPPPMENVRPFVRIGRLLKGLGFSAPEIYAEDPEAGFLLLEDLGDQTYTRELDAGGNAEQLYALATDTLIALHKSVPPAELDLLPVFEDARALREVQLLLDWYWPAHFGSPAPDDVRHEFVAAWQQILPLREAAPKSMALFDFHVDNLLVLKDRQGIAACGLLDFQDAVLAPVTFDLVSLLEDVRRHVPWDLMDRMIARYLAANPGIDRDAYMAAYAIIGAQRNTRIAGTFARLLKRDGKPWYQRFMPRVWELIAHDLQHPALAPVASWYARHLPVSERASLPTQ
ncbi:aminoglycoside phosphotransferase family protein [Dongia mobilis]|jgi:aminoglycoside/choline kinase family phosphotransferase|uniref:aminoglycoside phosphotransferase family protein n=1 Tax=Dongia sp. TaxID=1977262 RepID=UPI0026EA6874